MHYTDNLELQWDAFERHRHSEFQWFHKSVQYVDELFMTYLNKNQWFKEKSQLKRTICSLIQLLSSTYWLNGPITAVLKLREYKIE